MAEPLLLPYGAAFPQVADSAWLASGAILIGETVVGAEATVLFNCVLRGDVNRVEVGAGSNIQDLTMMHVADEWPCIVGSEVTVGHCALLHGCIIGDGCLIGMGARVLNGAVIGRGSIVAAGAVVPEGMQVPPGSLVAGVPAQLKGPVAAKHIPAGWGGSPGAYWASKYRLVAEAYRSGRAYRPNQGLELDSSE